MLNASRNGSGVDRAVAHRTRLGKRNKRKRQYMLESLETRTLLSYTFVYGGVNGPQVVNESGGSDSFTVANNGSGLLEWSTDGGATFSTQWGAVPADTLNAASAVSLTINLTGDHSAVIDGIGTASSPATSSASAVLAHIHANAAAANVADSLTVNDSASNLAAGTYTYNGNIGAITGPSSGINITKGVNSFGGGNTIEGSAAANTFDVVSTYASAGIGEPVNIEPGSASNTVNIGSGGTVAGIVALAPVAVFGGSSTLVVDDHNDTTHATATLDNLSGNPNAPYEVTGLSGGAIEYGAGVTAVNITGGTNGAAGVTFAINNTQAGTTTTINGGPNQNLFNLSNAAEAGGLDNLPGPVVVNGGASSTDVVTLDDSDADFNDTYTITSTTVSRTVFGGLTYGGIGTLTLLAENTLGTNGNNTIDINSTADGITTNVNGQGGVDTINVNSTGTGGTLNVITGGTDGSTVNVVADNQPVNVTLHANDFVNIGSTGGAGTMAGILGAIAISDPPAFFTLTFHDENDTTGHTWTLDNDDIGNTASVALSGGIATTSYLPADLASPLTINGGSGGNTFNVDNTTAFVVTDLNTGTGANTVNVFKTGHNTLNINGQGGADTVTLGALATAPFGMQGLSGTINVTNTSPLTALTLDDSADTTGQTASLTNDGTTGTVTGLAPATINYTDAGISSLTVLGGSGGNTFTVNGTLPGATTTLNKGAGGPNSADIVATNAGSVLDITGTGGPDTVTIGPGVLGMVNITETGPTSLVINLTNDGLAHDFVLSSDGTTTTLHDMLGNEHDITWPTATIPAVTIDTDPAFDQTLNVNFGGGGNPIPTTDTPGLIFNADGDGTGGAPAGTHALNIFGELPTGPFASETHNANDQTVFPQVGQYGSIFFNASADDDDAPVAINTSLDYTGLQPINDVTPAINYTFNDFGYPDQSFAATDGPGFMAFDTVQFANTPTPATPLNFETTNISNKVNVTFNTPTPVAGQPGNGVGGLVDLPTAYTGANGLATLTFNTSTGNTNTLAFAATPAAVVTTLNGSTSVDITNVLGTGVAAGTTLTLNGGSNPNVLTYDAGGLTPAITFPVAGEVAITVPGAGTVDAFDYSLIYIVDVAPTVPVPGTPIAVNSIEDFQLVNALVGTFTFPLPPGPGLPPATDFAATIDWGDGSPNTAGVITQAADGTYDVTGTHTYASPGVFTTGVTINFNGGTVTLPPVPGLPFQLPIIINLPPTTATSTSTATVTDGVIAVTAYPFVGTEGLPIGPITIGSFIDAGGADPVGDYAVSVAITSPGGLTTLLPGPFTVTQVGTSEQFEISTPAFTLPEEGTYQVLVSVTDTSDPPPVPTQSGAALAVIADAALTAGAATLLTPNTGVALPGTTVVATFTDANTFATTADYTASIDWGDGSPASTGVLVATATPGLFDVEGGHIYAKPGVYTTLVTVHDDGGSQVVITGSATVTDLPVTGATHNFTTTEGLGTGLFVLATFTDPNTLATVASENATLAVGGWGDGTPGVAGITLVVQEIGVTPLTSATDPGAPIFEVLGSHVYTEETPAGLPDTLSVIITTLGGATTTLTSPPGGGVTVLDAPLISSNGTEITDIEGTATPATTLLGTFVDANPQPPQGSSAIADFTAGGGSTVVNWGDGSALQTLTAANYTVTGSNNGALYSIFASHDYTEEGTYAYTVVVTDDGGSTTTISGSAIVADAPLSPSPPATQPTVDTTEATIFPVPVFAPPLFKGPVASYTDADPVSTIADFKATIDWGDGTPLTAGTISQPGGVGTAYIVSGAHTYADSGDTTGTGNVGHYAIQVFVVDDGGSILTVDNTANVADVSIPLTGQLNPASDSGLSTGTVDTTNVTQPNFTGKSEPLSTVTLSATLLPSGTPFIIGQVEAGSDGSWSITSDVPLADGHYTITATAIDQFGETTVTNPASPVVITSNLLIDTTGPVIDGMFFNRLNGQVDYIIKDPVPASGGAPSGVWVNTLLDSSDYLLTKVHAYKAYPGKWVVTNVTATPDPTIPFAYDVAVTFNGGAIIKGGFYLFTIRDSSNGNSSVQDLAENHLDGVFYGSFPSGNGINGSDFVAELQAYHNKVFAPQTIIGTSSAANGGVGGLPVAPVHSGIWVPVIPVGGSPIFSTSTSPSNGADPPAGSKKITTLTHNHKVTNTTHKAAKPVVKVVNHTIAKTKVHDTALHAVASERKAKSLKK